MLLDKPLSPPPRLLPLGIPTLITIIEKYHARGTMGRGKRREPGPRFISFPFPSSPKRFLFPSPQPSYDTKRPLRRREDNPARQPALELMRRRADRASERTQRVLEGNYRGDSFTPVSFRVVCFFNLDVPALYNTDSTCRKKITSCPR